MTMAYIMLALYVVTLGTMSYLLGFVFGMLVPGMVLAFVLVQLLTNIIFFYLINFKTDWEKCINIMIENQEKAEKSNTEMVRAKAASSHNNLGTNSELEMGLINKKDY